MEWRREGREGKRKIKCRFLFAGRPRGKRAKGEESALRSEWQRAESHPRERSTAGVGTRSF